MMKKHIAAKRRFADGDENTRNLFATLPGLSQLNCLHEYVNFIVSDQVRW